MFDQPGHLWFGVLCTAVFLGMTVGFPLWVRHRRARIQKLLAQLSERAGEDHKSNQFTVSG